MIYLDAIPKIVAAHERRWGRSVMPIRVVQVIGSNKEAWSLDDENGSAIKWNYAAWRIRRLDEKQPSL